MGSKPLPSDFRAVLDRFGTLLDASGNATNAAASDLDVVPMSGGLINDTYALGPAHVLQRLHKIFRPEVNLDIAALTVVLSHQGLPVPRLSPTSTGELWAEISDPEELAGTWRIMSRLPGRTLHRVENTAQAASVGAALGAFHAALMGVEHRFNFVRRGPHDTNLHMMRLWTALDAFPKHRLFEEVRPVAVSIFDGWKAWGEEPVLPRRIIHGDPKVSNFLLDDDRVVGIIDLDTMAWGTLDSELGDALRSWCACAESDAGQAASLDLLQAAVSGYLSVARAWITEEEVEALPTAAERIALELAARFAADALREEYFGWDPDVAPTRGDHNLLRARNQLALAADLHHKRGQLRGLVLEA